MRKLLSLIACLVLGSAMMMAQTVVKGSVISSEDGEPVIGAAVLVTGTTTGTTTDFDGKFSLKVPSDAKSLTVSYVGMTPQEVALDHSDKPVFVKLMPSNVLDDVVVTAQGISRSEKSLGYSATTLKASDITVGNNANAMTSLQGKVAGMQISAQSSAPGATNNVVIRGFSSINGSNQPLYVIDGVPMDQTVISGMGQNLAAGGISNVSPDDIASMTVLKGAAATALYGSRAANGVILVTTKTGARGVGRNYQIEYSYGLQANKVSYLPTFQNQFGQGWNGTQTFIENGSWGAAFDGSYQLYGPIYNGQQLGHYYNSVENNVIEFFEAGINQTHNASINGVSDDGKLNYFLSYNYTDQDGIMPTDADVLKRNTISMRASYEPNKWLKVSSSMNFAKSKLDAVGTFQGTSVIDGILEMPRDVSIRDLKNTSSSFNTPAAYFTPYGITNPYWAIENNYNHTDSKQVFGKVQVDIKPIKDLTLSYRFGFDYTDYDRKIGYPEIALDDALVWDDMGYAPSNMNQAGYVYASYGRRYELNHDFSANYNKSFLDDFNVNASAGLNVNERSRTTIAGQTDELTFTTGFWDLSNGATKTTLEENQSKRRLVGLWGNVALSWKEKVFLDLTARNDWSSTLPIDANSFFYPGATLSYLFSEDLPENEILTFGKVRLAYGKTGNDANPYRTQSAYTQAYANGYYGSDIAKFPMNGINAFIKDYWKGSSSLKPEMTTEFEVGANFGFYDGRVAFDFSYYNRETDDQIFTLPIDPATGYSSMVTNFGKVSNKGVELVLNTIPFQNKNWKWTLDFNWSKNVNKVESLPESLEGGKVSIYNFSAGNDAIYMYAEVGKPMGQFYTYRTAYVDGGEVNYEGRGQMLVDNYGQPVLSSSTMDTGKNMNNKWTGGVNTSLTAYGVTLSAQLDIRYGGYMFSRTRNLMQFTGNSDVTTYNQRRPFVIPNSVVAAGEDANGKTLYEANTSPIYTTNSSYQDYFNDYGAGLGGEFYLVDRSFVKLRNVSLSYALPRKVLAPTLLTAVNLSVFVNNVFTWTAKDNRFLDPENTTINQSSYGDLATQFGELYSNPSCRTYGFNINVKF